MYKLLFSTAVLLLTTTHAIDLTHYIGMVCDGLTMVCLDVPYGFCCQSADPFCGTGACGGCVDGDDVFGFRQARCDVQASDSCREPGPAGQGCCVGTAFGGNTCALQAIQPGAVKRDGANESNCSGTVEPNQLNYVDGRGAARSVYLPPGTFKSVVDDFINQDWEALTNLPVWGKLNHDAR